MTNSRDLLRQDALLAEASRWFAALDAGNARPEEFEAWRQRDTAHAVAYARVVATWEGIDAPAAVARADSPIRLTRRGWLQAAAIGLPVAVVGSGFFAQRAYAWENAVTGLGEMKRVALSDGSVAHLNTDTSLSWRFGSDERLLRLDRGEVMLDMKGGSEAAVLRVDDVRLPLSAGLFDARVTPVRAELTLVDGATMDLPDTGTPMALRPKDTLVVDAAGTRRVENRGAERVDSQLAWRSGEIVFLDQSVADATAEFNRYLTRKITVGDAKLAQEKIGGRFDLSRPDQFLSAVALSLNARVDRTDTGHELTR